MIGSIQVLLIALAFVLGVGHGINHEPANDDTDCTPNATTDQETLN